MSLSLVADIGGTNGRFAIFNGKQLSDFQSYKCAEFDCLQDMLSLYLNSLGGVAPKSAVMAVATYIKEDRVEFTNLAWSFSVKGLAKSFGFSHLKVFNDFTSVAIAVPLLKGQQLTQVGGDVSPEQGFAKAVIGPGTGLGVSGLFQYEKTWVPIQGQGGHIAWAPTSPLAKEFYECARKDLDYISAENLLSGPGLLLIYRYICAVLGKECQSLESSEIVSSGIAGRQLACVKTLELFCETLGGVAGDLCLTLGARSGVYVAGGVTQHMLDFITGNDFFRENFEQKGCMYSYMKNIPVYIIEETKVGLLGAVQATKDEYQFLGVTYKD